MTLAEFKAWLEGFEAAMNGPPTAEQWATIKAKIGKVTEGPKPIYRDPQPRSWFVGNGQLADGAIDRR